MNLNKLPAQRSKPFYKDANVALSMEENEACKIISFTATIFNKTKVFKVGKDEDPLKAFQQLEQHFEKQNIPLPKTKFK